jgi:hypothetical protein
MCDWDPIGIMDNMEASRNEYDCLIGPLLTQLASFASDQPEILNQKRWFEIEFTASVAN